ncbi:MAG TPA: Nif3-like dinuclear metal center hexameric protein [Capsulimonadaceae bacterium]|jgi:dinuclear metal center YbgI/SA1388 family protein
MQLDEILTWLRSIAPEETAFTGDPVGLLVRTTECDITNVSVTLDATPATVSATVDSGSQLLVCHHPLIYAPLKRVLASDPIGSAVSTLVTSGVALYAMHTNWDRAVGGVNDTLAGLLSLTDIVPLEETGDAQIARVGNLPEPMTAKVFASFIGRALDVTNESALRYNSRLDDTMISRVAVCGGAGASLVSSAIAAGADAFVTSDVRHHEFVDANVRRFPLFDAGHGATERPGMAALAQRIRAQFPQLNVSYHE